MDVLAHNVLAAAICPMPANIVRHVFLDPAAREIYPDWWAVAAESAAALRASALGMEDDPGLTALGGELSLKSPEFRGLWARHEVRAKSSGTKRMRTGEGLLEVTWETLSVASAPGQQVVAYLVRPGSADVLDRLRAGAGAP
ncbi:MmyB family transcriptional regulator [Pseudonocardia pini]|uniref:MmyB family transcriptional regulator n=1 Tax=Pseudonocardia pini TaxID=2758030 RepID=UPI0028A68410|nr:hypothetical protein [Pseudonocardia pini]